MMSRISLRRRLLLILGPLVVLAVCIGLWRFSVWPLTTLAIFQQYLQLILVGVLSLGLIFAILWKVPKWQAAGVPDIKDRLTVENAARQTLAQIIGGAVLLAGLFFTWATLKTAQEGQITDRFTKAIAQLGDTQHLTVRLGGIYALERIAKDSGKDHWPIMEVLTAYVRETAPWLPKAAQPSKGDQGPQEEPPAMPKQPLPKLAADIQAILTVLGRRTHTYGKGEEQGLNLAKTALGGANLLGAQLQGADLSGAQLQEAGLYRAQLQEAFLNGAQLQRAGLSGAQLQGADLSDAQLEGADLQGAQLEGAKNLTVTQLSTVKTLDQAQLDPSLLEQIQQQYFGFSGPRVTKSVIVTRCDQCP
jgi:hypothetical protein